MRYSGAVFKSFDTLEKAKAFAQPVGSVDADSFEELAYTDGSFSEGRAGGAAVFPRRKCAFLQAEEVKSNNRGELLGILLALQQSKGSLLIRSDSQYSINVCSNGYTAHENLDLVEKIQKAAKGRRVHFEYVPAHSGIQYNEMADWYADKARLLDPKAGVSTVTF